MVFDDMTALTSVCSFPRCQTFVWGPVKCTGTCLLLNKQWLLCTKSNATAGQYQMVVMQTKDDAADLQSWRAEGSDATQLNTG